MCRVVVVIYMLSNMLVIGNLFKQKYCSPYKSVNMDFQTSPFPLPQKNNPVPSHKKQQLPSCVYLFTGSLCLQVFM